MFKTSVNIFHFLAPFIINIISALVIILMAIRQRATIQIHHTYRNVLHGRSKQHRHLLIASIVLVIPAIPRLFISFFSGCMKSINDS
jgi:hypothetical protein